jgi:rhodanese-related sulfurtransferase
MSALTIDTQKFLSWLTDGEELAVLDVRDATAHGKGAPLYAANLPASRTEREIDNLIPRRGVRTVLADAGDGQGRALAERLRAAGWTSLVALEGGVPAWLAETDEGRPTAHTPPLDFSLGIRDEKATPALSVRQLAELKASGVKIAILDSRTTEEYIAEHVPGAISAPGAELVLRFDDLVPSPDTLVAVSCAGLPRAIIGAQSLIDAGVPNRVFYLDDGTKAWREAGFKLENGGTAVYGPVSPKAREAAEQRLKPLAADDAVPEIDLATARSWRADPARTTYLVDVRTPEEFAAEHLPETQSSPGGQLLAAAWRALPVRGARVVLIDDRSGARAAVTAHWLRRWGFELAIVRHAFAQSALQAVA